MAQRSPGTVLLSADTKIVASGLLACVLSVGCVQARPPTDTGDPVSSGSPTSPSAPPVGGTGALAYDPDMKALFASDCVSCHGPSRADGNYRMTTYQEVMRAARPGIASSALVVVTQSNGSMYRFFSGGSSTRQSKAQMVRQWIVTDNALQTR